MPQIILDIPADKAEYALVGFLKVHPNDREQPNPSYVEGGEEPEFIPVYTDIEWVKKVLMEKIIKDVKRGHQLIGYDAVSVEEDSSIVN